MAEACGRLQSKAAGLEKIPAAQHASKGLRAWSRRGAVQLAAGQGKRSAIPIWWEPSQGGNGPQLHF